MYTGRDTIGQAVDSSAIVCTSGNALNTSSLKRRRNVDRLDVLAAAVLVRHPLAGLARVVEVEHRRDRVDAQAVGVVALEPEERAREQEAAHLVAAVVEDRSCASRDDGPGAGRRARRGACRRSSRGRARRWGNATGTQSRITPMPARCSVSTRIHEVLGRAVAARRREVAGGLVAPRPVEGMLHHRQELDVGEAHLAEVGRQRLGQARGRSAAAAARRMPAATSRGASRRSRSAPPSALRAARVRSHVAVAPRGTSRSHTTEAVCGGVSQRSASGSALSTVYPLCAGDEVVLVQGAGRNAGDEALPRCPSRCAGRIGCRFTSQPLKSPATLTERAFGAHTAKKVPSRPPLLDPCARRASRAAGRASPRRTGTGPGRRAACHRRAPAAECWHWTRCAQAKLRR